MALVIGNTYYIKNVATGKYLNVSGNEIASNGRNVNVYRKENCLAEKWTTEFRGNGVVVKSLLAGGAYGLNINQYSSNYNCTIWTLANNTDTDCVIDFMTVNAGLNRYRIKMMGYNKYLRVVSSTDNNAVWVTPETSDYTLWELEEVTNNVTINLRNMISSYNQRPDFTSACAGICGCMAINTSPYSLDYNTYLYPANWSGLAGIVGKTASVNYSPSLIDVYNVLRAGYPAIVRIRPETNPHWVIVYKYSGDGTTFSASDFYCIDPWGVDTVTTEGRDCRLNESVNYNSVQKLVYFH